MVGLGGNKEITIRIRPHAGLSRVLVVFLKITIGALAVSVLAALYGAYTYATLPANVDPTETTSTADIVWSLARYVRNALFLITFIIFLWWTYRTNKNLRALSKSAMEFTPGWSVGWWFIPIANFWKPYQVMKEIWHASHGNEATDHSVVGWWWALWLISFVVAPNAQQLVRFSFDASGIATAYLLQIALDGLDITYFVVTLILVTRIRAAYAKNIIEPTGREYGGPAVAAPPPVA